jgi:hypothetical protein
VRFIWLATVVALVGCAPAPPVVHDDASSPATASATTPLTSTGDCATTAVALTWHPGQPSASTFCVHVGAPLAIRLYPPDLHRWTAPSTSDSQTVAVEDFGDNLDGVMSANLSVVKTGSAILRCVAMAREGAPDPADTVWQVTVTVVA